MKGILATCILATLPLMTPARACEPPDDSYYPESMAEERELVLQALSKSDLVVVGRIDSVNAPKAANPTAQSEVRVWVHQILFQKKMIPRSLTLTAALSEVAAGCFGNEAFWDDQVEKHGVYILFVSNGRIISATAPSTGWARLGLTGQREVVLSSVGRK